MNDDEAMGQWTPAATIYEYQTSTGEIWQLIDFGEDGKFLSELRFGKIDVTPVADFAAAIKFIEGMER